MLPIGVKQCETLRGTLRFIDRPDEERKAWFDAQFAVVDWTAFAAQGTTRLTGAFSCEGFVEDAAFEGTLDIDPVRRRLLLYEFTFKGPDGRTVRFQGEKRIEFLNIPKTMTTLYSRLLVDDRVIAIGVLHFDLKDLPAFLASVRPVKL